MNKLFFIALIALAVFSSCENEDWEFPDYDFSTVYFAYQYPVRTITLGEDVFDTSLDNEHKCKIMATMGGVYKNKSNIIIDFKVDNSLCDGFIFKESNSDIKAMPSNYYTLASNQIIIPKGSIIGGVEVQLTDAFFADPEAIENTYVIPIVMNSVQNVDSILRGTPKVINPSRCVAGDWDVSPKDYILYAVKYINPWHANYLRRGKDIIKGKNGDTSQDKTVVRHEKYVENDQICKMVTRSRKQTELPLSIKDKNNQDIHYNLILTFDDAGKCNVSSESDNYVISGSGQFVEKGDKKSWGDQDRNVIYLSYEVDFNSIHCVVTDTLVVRDRGVAMETFNPVLK